MKINIIAAIGQNNEIGLNNQLLWKSKSDLALFKKLTLGKPIIMGRKTFESLPGILPDRPHIVITSNQNKLKLIRMDDKQRYVPSLEAALTLCSIQYDEVFIIGGASIYKQALPLADELHISHMDWTGEADTFFPEIGSEWITSANAPDEHIDIYGPNWSYCKYTRIK